MSYLEPLDAPLGGRIPTVRPEWIVADIVAEIPDAPVGAVLRAIMRAARKLADTCLYREWLRVPTQAGVRTYPLEKYMPSGMSAHFIHAVRFRGCCLPRVDDSCHSRCRHGYRLDDMHQITLVGQCPEDAHDSLEVDITYRVKPDACELPVDMVERFETELRDGAFAALFGMAGQPWTNFALGEKYRNDFLGGLASMKCLIAQDMEPGASRIEAECFL